MTAAQILDGKHERILVAGSNRLPILGVGINDHLAAAEAATKRGLEHAIAAGLLMIEAKGLVDHGKWLLWLQANCHVGVRQAQTFMRLARNRHKVEAFKNAAAAHLTIATAEALVGRPRPERPHGLPGQLDMLGGPAAIALPKAPTLRGRALFDLIVDLEQALAVIEQEKRRLGQKRRAKLDATTSTIAEVIAHLKSEYQHRGRKR
jgi:hypothetical protein